MFRANHIFDIQKQIDEYTYENEKLKNKTNEITFKINNNGAISIYGLSKYPIKLFPEQIYNLFDKEHNLRKFITDNKDHLSWS
jgi:hypothetical protein